MRGTGVTDRRVLVAPLIVLVWLAAARSGADESSIRRVAVVVGSNTGVPGDVPLRFARRDARRLARTLAELGSVSRQDLFLLLDVDAERLRETMHEAAARARSSADAMLIFYFSGHAGDRALHLGGSELAWEELRGWLQDESIGLRLALIDTCQAGTLSAPKGFVPGPPLGQQGQHNRGSVLLMAAGSTETAQETMQLGGSFFTHYLVSALRGAADADGDHRVTLAEAHAYTTRHTRWATATWARSVQHPIHHFDIRGHGDVVLTDLRRAAATLHVDERLAGHLVVCERGSTLVLVESDKRAGEPLRLALPNGRYVVHLRKPRAVYLAEVTLPWGGEATLAAEDLEPRSYQEVAQKGGVIEIHRHRLRLGGAVQSPIVSGMGALGVFRLGYGLKLAKVELGLRLLLSAKTFPTADTEVDTTIYGGSLLVVYERPAGNIDLRLWGMVEGHYWRQDVARQGLREAGVFGLGLGGGLRLPMTWRLFGELSLEGMLYLPDLEDRGVSIRAAISAGASVGVLF